MLLNFFSINSKRDEPGSLDYLIKNETARVVRGDPKFAKWIIDHSPPGPRQRFASGVINDLTELDRSHDETLLDELELLFLAGRPKSAMVWCVIEHTDKNKRELHFVIVLYDLLFGKYIYPYVDRIDRHAFSAWSEKFSLTYNLTIPSEKLRTEPAFQDRGIRRCDIEFLKMVWKLVNGWVVAKLVKCRKDLEKHLTKTGFKTRFQTHKGKPLQQPVIIGPDGVKLRLKNSIYYRPDFGSPCLKPIDRSDQQAVKRRLSELQKIIDDWIEFRSHHMIGRLFGRLAQKTVAKGKAKQRLQELIDVKLKSDRDAYKRSKNVNLVAVLAAAEFIKCGTIPKIPSQKKVVTTQASPVEITSKKSIEVTDALIGYTPASQSQAINPEVFQPPVLSESSLAATLLQKSVAVPKAPPIADSRRRKSKEPVIE